MESIATLQTQEHASMLASFVKVEKKKNKISAPEEKTRRETVKQATRQVFRGTQKKVGATHKCKGGGTNNEKPWPSDKMS